MRIIVLTYILFAICVSLKAQEDIRPRMSISDNYIDYIYLGYDTFNVKKIPKVLKYYYSYYIDFENETFFLDKEKEVSIHIERATPITIESRLVIITRNAQKGYLFINKRLAAWLNTQEDKNEVIVILYRINGVELSKKEDAELLISLKRNKVKDVVVYRSEINEVVVDVKIRKHPIWR